MARSISYHELCKDEGADLSPAWHEGYAAVGEIEDGYDGNPFEEDSQEYADWADGYSQRCDDDDSRDWSK